MKKKLLTAVLASAITLTSVSFAEEVANYDHLIMLISSRPDYVFTVDNVCVDLDNSEMYHIADTTMLPLRKIAEALDFTVDWFADDQSILIHNNDKNVQIKIGSTIIRSSIINGIANTELTITPELRDGKTFVPEELFSYIMDGKETHVIAECYDIDSENSEKVHPNFESAAEQLDFIPRTFSLYFEEKNLQSISTLPDNILKVVFVDQDNTITAKMSPSLHKSSLEFNPERTVDIDGLTAVLESDDMVSAIYWDDNAYSFSLSFEKEVSEATAIKYAEEIHNIHSILR